MFRVILCVVIGLHTCSTIPSVSSYVYEPGQPAYVITILVDETAGLFHQVVCYCAVDASVLATGSNCWDHVQLVGSDCI